MTLGPLMLDIAGTELSAADADLLRHPLVGGVVLFSRNFADPAQLAALCNAIHTLREPRLLIAADHEGGRVQRFREGFSALPPMAALGALFDRDADAARQLARQIGWLLASELRACGVDLAFAPVLDLQRDRSGVIGSRAFHTRADIVATLAQALARGMHDAGMAATGKHFPGHGGVAEDSHQELPSDGREYAQIEAADLRPFARLIRQGIASLMTAHVVYPRVDAQAATFSSAWLQGCLRQSLGFDGALFSDDLSMAAARAGGEVVARCARALQAGCDMVLLCNDREAAGQVIDGLRFDDDPVAQLRRTRLHGKPAPDGTSLRALDEWQRVSDAVARLDFAPELG